MIGVRKACGLANTRACLIQTNDDLAYRKDIDGLRAIAIISVVLFHAAPNLLPSGFVGVDIFFVISGYLIGGIIYKSAINRTFSFSAFYARRIRRLAPAFLMVACVYSILGAFLFDKQEMLEYSAQTLCALIGASNLYFWKHVDYFAPSSDQEPMLMTWSLGVEEQFYLLFPLLLVSISGFKPRSRFGIIVILTILSFTISVYAAIYHPIAAFYMLPSRAWEMGIGALFAIAALEFPRAVPIRKGLANSLGALSVIGLIAATVLFDDKTPFPGVSALVPVVSTVALIANRNSFVNSGILSNSVLIFIGQISYSWYLWHWPMMAIARRSADESPSEAWMLGIALLSLALGALSWHFIEKPGRKDNRRFNTMGYCGLVFCLLFTSLIAIKFSGGWPQRLPSQVLAVEFAQHEGRGNCLVPFDDEHLLNDPECYPAFATVALLGDSHASAYGTGLISFARAYNIKVAQFSKSACPPLRGFLWLDPQHPFHAQQCENFLNEAIKRILDDHCIKTVFLSADWPLDPNRHYFRLSSGANVNINSTVVVQQGLSVLSDLMKKSGKELVIVSGLPKLRVSPVDHMIGDLIPLRRLIGRFLDGGRRLSGNTFRVMQADPLFEIRRDNLKEIAYKLNLRFFDPSLQLCDHGECYFTRGALPLYYDKHHLSAEGSRSIVWSDFFDKSDKLDDSARCRALRSDPKKD